VGLGYPKTTEDFKQTLIAFRDKDAAPVDYSPMPVNVVK
jgi:hypothetical protein